MHTRNTLSDLDSQAVDSFSCTSRGPQIHGLLGLSIHSILGISSYLEILSLYNENAHNSREMGSNDLQSIISIFMVIAGIFLRIACYANYIKDA